MQHNLSYCPLWRGSPWLCYNNINIYANIDYYAFQVVERL